MHSLGLDPMTLVGPYEIPFFINTSTLWNVFYFYTMHALLFELQEGISKFALQIKKLYYIQYFDTKSSKFNETHCFLWELYTVDSFDCMRVGLEAQ